MGLLGFDTTLFHESLRRYFHGYFGVAVQFFRLLFLVLVKPYLTSHFDVFCRGLWGGNVNFAVVIFGRPLLGPSNFEIRILKRNFVNYNFRYGGFSFELEIQCFEG